MSIAKIITNSSNSTHGIRNSFLNYFKTHCHTVVPSSNLVPIKDESLLFNVAGMCQFKDNFLNPKVSNLSRATSAQKCLRVGGKHNDLDNIGKTARHQTFFEMLGNFSFGDYSRRDAIHFAWNYLTKELNLPAERLAVSVLVDDEESFNIWKNDMNLPKEKIFLKSTEDNFWTMNASSGPCGPCTEIFWDQLEEVDGDRYLEIWNLVFMKYEMLLGEDQKIHYIPLERQCIDTGMGLERLASVVQNVPTNFDIDVVMPLRLAITNLMNVAEMESNHIDIDPFAVETSIRIIMDHVRAVTMLLAEGVLPDNKKRGAVVRRLIRRALLYGYKLGIKEPFLATLVPIVIQQTGGDDWFPELNGENPILSVVKYEEELYFSNVDTLFSTTLKKTLNSPRLIGKVVSAQDAYEMYTSCGIPLEFIIDYAERSGVKVDTEGFYRIKENSQALSRTTWVGSGDKALPAVFLEWQEDGLFPEFIGYDTLECSTATLAGFVPSDQDSSQLYYAWIALRECPFYPESGGQSGDIGHISLAIDGEYAQFSVCDTIKPYPNGIAVKIQHQCINDLLEVCRPGTIVECHVDTEARQSIAQTHSACHLLHAVLRDHLGSHVFQSGSKVSRGHFRLDFTHHSPIDSGQLSDIEDSINQAIYFNRPILSDEMSYTDAKKAKAMGVFSERYPEHVRVVGIEGWSKEICCGTHVRSTGEIMAVKIISESSNGKGNRRIECFVGKSAIVELFKKSRKCDEIAVKLKSSNTGDDSTELLKKLQLLISENSQLKTKLREKTHALGSQSSPTSIQKIEKLYKDVDTTIYEFDGRADPDNLRKLSQKFLSEKQGAECKLFVLIQENHVLLFGAGPKINCGAAIRKLLRSVDGKGGGNKGYAEGKFAKIDAGTISAIFDSEEEELFEF